MRSNRVSSNMSDKHQWSCPELTLISGVFRPDELVSAMSYTVQKLSGADWLPFWSAPHRITFPFCSVLCYAPSHLGICIALDVGPGSAISGIRFHMLYLQPRQWLLSWPSRSHQADSHHSLNAALHVGFILTHCVPDGPAESAHS